MNGFVARPSGDFAPAGDLLFAPPKSRQKALPCDTAPAGCPACHAACMRHGVRQASHSTQVLCSVLPHCIEAQGRAELASLRSAQTGGAKSVLEACFARALGFCASRRFRRGGPKTAQQPSPKSGRWMYFCMPSFSPAEQRKALKPRAKRASRTDSARLSDRSVAKGVLRGASRTEQRRGPRRGGAVRGELFAYFLAAQKVSRPPGRNPGMGLTTNQPQREAH